MSAVPATPAAGRIPPSLLFTLGGERCRLELTRLEAVAPWAALEASDEPDVVGWLLRHGERIPVVDLSQIAYGEQTPRQLGSRILLLRCSVGNGQQRCIGVLAGEVFAIARQGQHDSVQRFDPCDLLPASLRRPA